MGKAVAAAFGLDERAGGLAPLGDPLPQHVGRHRPGFLFIGSTNLVDGVVPVEFGL